jgi:hypothetical protein
METLLVILELLDWVPHLESEREGVLEIIGKVKALIERALEYSKDLMLDTNSLVYLFGKDFFSLVLPPLLSSMVIMS